MASHVTRVGYYGYAFRRHPREIIPLDNRAFRDITVQEVVPWMVARRQDPTQWLFAVRRRLLAWTYKMSHNWHQFDPESGAYGNLHFMPSGSFLMQVWFLWFVFWQLFYTYDHMVHGKYRKYHW